MEPQVLCANGLSFKRGQQTVLEGVDLSLSSGDMLALLGVNGAGKTTLLRCLLGLLKPSEGQVTLEGKALSDWPRHQLARHLAYVPQAHVAPFPFSVREVVALGRLPHQRLLQAETQADAEAVGLALEQLSITALAQRPYTELSGGERQLTLIARALAQGARLLIMDEPVSGLDFGHQIRLLRHLERLAAQGYGILQTTHYPDHALAYANRVAVLHQGRIEADDVPTQVITVERIRRLYQIDVEIVPVSSGRHALIY